jgi:chorismate--pyruvate lyase
MVEWRGGWRRDPLPAGHPLSRWLTDGGSLTARLQARCDRFEVRVLAQGLARPHRDEAGLLGVRAGRLVMLREVLLCADGVPVVYARSVLARDSLRGAWRMFSGIGSRPLGAALFADPCVTRGALVARRLDGRDPRHDRALAAAGLRTPTRLWARRSCFIRDGAPLVVCEVFLPGIEALPR